MAGRLIQLKSRDGAELYPQVDAESIPAGAVTEAKIADGAVAEGKLSSDVGGSVSGSSQVASLLKEALKDRRHFADPFVKAGLVNIPFEDEAVKKILVANYDTDGDGEISYAEAQAVPVDWQGWPVNDFKGNTKIRSFRELRFFDKIGQVGNGGDMAKAFNGCTSLTDIELPDNITMVGNSTFGDCVSLEAIDIPASVTAIGSYAFQGCTKLREVTLREGLETMGGFTFRGDTALELAELPSTVKSIGSGCFSGCTKLALTSLPAGLTTLGGEAFFNTAVAFSELPSRLSGMLEGHTFANTQVSLTALPDGITGIEYECFLGCPNLALTELPDGVTKIGTRAFGDCPGLTAMTIGGKITDMLDGAFQNDTNLKDVTISATTPPTLGSNAFPSGVTIYVPDASLEAYKAATNWGAYTIKAVSEKTATTETTTTETTTTTT